MPYLIAAVVLVGCLCALDLLLTIGVIRRLREHSETLAAVRQLQRPDATLLRPGTMVPDVSAVTSDGTEVALRSLTQVPSLVAFLSTSCEACLEQLPRVERYARGMPGGRSAVLAVIAGDSTDAENIRARLQPVAQVVVEPEDGPLAREFAVNVWPAYLLVGQNGVVDAVGSAVERLPALGQEAQSALLSSPAG